MRRMLLVVALCGAVAAPAWTQLGPVCQSIIDGMEQELAAWDAQTRAGGVEGAAAALIAGTVRASPIYRELREGRYSEAQCRDAKINADRDMARERARGSTQ